MEAFLLDLWSDRGPSNMKKTCKFIVLSFKMKGLLNNMETRSGRCQYLIFYGFVTSLGRMEEFLDDIVASLLEVGFSIDFEEDPGLREHGPVRG